MTRLPSPWPTSPARTPRTSWRINAHGGLATVHQRKINGNASGLLERTAATVTFDHPRHLVTDVAVPTITSGHDALHFLPDRLLLRTGKRYSDVSYAILSVNPFTRRFIEFGTVPTDGVHVDTTWQFANVNGGPDRRFENNRMLPIMHYGNVQIASPSGLNWDLQFARVNAFDRAAHTLRQPRTSRRSQVARPGTEPRLAGGSMCRG